MQIRLKKLFQDMLAFSQEALSTGDLSQVLFRSYRFVPFMDLRIILHLVDTYHCETGRVGKGYT